MNQLTTPEVSIIQESERAAMGKLADIYSTPFVKHAFPRFPYPKIEGYISNSAYAISEEDIIPGVDRLKGVLLTGVVSDKFARRINIPISKNWKDPANETAVSLVTIDRSLNQAMAYFAIPAEHELRQPRVDLDHSVVILLDPSLTTEPEKILTGAALKKIRVSTKFFKGIVIIDDPSVLFVTPYDRQTLEFNPEKNAKQIAELMNGVYGDHTERYLPVYGNSGALYWPKHMTYDEVKKYLEEKGQK